MDYQEELSFDIVLHYYLQDANTHSIDAIIHNKAERYLLYSLQELNKYVGGGIVINVNAVETGGLVDRLNVQWTKIKPITKELLDPKVIVTTVLATFLTYNFSATKTTNIKNRVEIAKTLRYGGFSEGEISTLIDNDAVLMKWKSEYYKAISDEATITKVSVDCKNLSDNTYCASAFIERKDFSSNIISLDEITETHIIEGVTIYIISPILVKGAAGRKAKWKGVYSGMVIDFRVADTAFLNQVYNKEVKFGNGTCIKCSLSITTTTTYPDNNPDNPNVKSIYVVDNITQWADDEHFYYETKRYKRLKGEGNYAGSLFDEILDDNNQIESNQHSDE